jgi:hypothetical protein
MPIDDAPSAQVPVGQTQRQNHLLRTRTISATDKPIHEVVSNVRVVSQEARVVRGLKAGTSTGSCD